MRFVDGDNPFSIVEGIPEPLGTAVVLREELGLPPELPLPDLVVDQPREEARDEISWSRWWSFLVTASRPGSVVPKPGEILQEMAGDAWRAAHESFTERKLSTVRAMSEHGLTRSEAWRQIGGAERFRGHFAIDIVPAEAVLAHRVAPHYWLLSSRSRRDDSVLTEIFRTELSAG